MKKILAVLLTLIMTLAMTVTAFAEGETTTKPTAADHATATVNNVEATATVTAYQIVKADYNEFGFTGYSSVKRGGAALVADPLAPTSTEITAIAKDTTGLKAVTMAKSGGATEGLTSFTADLEPGYW